MRVWLQIQGSQVRSGPGPILSWRLIMKWFLLPFSTSAEWIIQEGLLSITSESTCMCTKYWLITCSSLSRKTCGLVNWPSRNDHSCWRACKATKQTSKPDYIQACTQEFGTIARMRPLKHIVGLETYCVRYALILLQLNVYKSSKVSSEALWRNTGLVVSLPLADASSTKILLKRDCVNSLADLSECCSQYVITSCSETGGAG